MQFKLLMGLLLVAIAYAIVTKPFRNIKRMKEFANHLLIAFASYYGTYGILFALDWERDVAIGIAAAATCLALVVVNMFFRSPET